MSDPTHFSIALPLTLEQGEEAETLLENFDIWVGCKVNEEDFTLEVSDDDIAFFERIYSEEFEDWTGIEIIFKGETPHLDDESGEPSVQLAGDFVSALMDRFDIDGTLNLHWSGSGAGSAVISRNSIVWPGNEVQVTAESNSPPTIG